MEMLLPAVAVALDLLVGDPKALPHPVQAIGALIRKEEAWARGLGLGLRPAGIALAAANALLAFIVVRLLTAIPVLGLAFWLYFAWSGLALGQLLREGRAVNALLAAGDLPEARAALAGLVSRDTSALDEQGVRKALAETLAENLNDGFFAPFLFLVVGGPALMWAYKAVSTMDSLWGYKTPEYADLGYGAAKADDILAWIPARLTAFAMMGAGWFMGKDALRAFDNTPADAAKAESPNAGWPMAAAAWLMGAPLGGPAVYYGRPKDKPTLGPSEGRWDDALNAELVSLLLRAGLLGGAVMYLYTLMLAMAK